MVINLGPVYKITYKEIWYRKSTLPENIFPPISANDLNRDIRAGIDTALQPKTRKRSASNQSLRRPTSRDGHTHTPLAAAIPVDNKVPIIPSIELDAPNGVDETGGSRPSTANSLQLRQARSRDVIARDGIESTSFQPKSRSRDRSPSQSRRSQDGYNTLPILKESPTMNTTEVKAREGGDGVGRPRRFSQLSHLSVQANPGVEEPPANPTKQISIDDSAPSMPENIKMLMKSMTGLSNRTLDGTNDFDDDPVIMETTKLAHKHDEKGQKIEIAFSSACGMYVLTS